MLVTHVLQVLTPEAADKVLELLEFGQLGHDLYNIDTQPAHVISQL